MIKKGQEVKVNKDGAVIRGIVKDIKYSFGHQDVLVTTGTAEDFWTRNAKKVRKS